MWINKFCCVSKRCPKKNDHILNVVFPIVEKVFNVILKTAKNTTPPKFFFTFFVKKVEKRLKYGGNDFFSKTKKINQKNVQKLPREVLKKS